MEIHDLWRAFSFYPLPSLEDSTTAADVYGCCGGRDCPHEVVDHGVLLLVRDGHGHVTRGTARLVLGVHGARWHGDRDRVQHGVHGVLGQLRRLLAASLIV